MAKTAKINLKIGGVNTTNGPALFFPANHSQVRMQPADVCYSTESSTRGGRRAPQNVQIRPAGKERVQVKMW